MRRVFIYSSRSIFSQGIKQLLDEQPDLDIVGWETDPKTAIRRIEELAPDTILMVRKNECSELLPGVWCLLRAVAGKARIVELNAENNTVHVFWGEQCAISELGELVSLIEDSRTSCAGSSCRTE